MIFVVLTITVLWLLTVLLSPMKATKSFEERCIYAPGAKIDQIFKLDHHFSAVLQYLHSQYIFLQAPEWTYPDTKKEFYKVLGQAWLVLMLSTWLSYITGEIFIWGMGGLGAAILIAKIFQDTNQKVKRRRQNILLELPILLTRLTLLIGAGETVQQAFIRTIEGKENSLHPLHMEWKLVVNALKNGQSFPQSIEKFNRRCSVQQISLFTTLLILNYRMGGERFTTSVQDLSHSLWETRKTLAMVKGEEASSKLIFPLVGILLLLMILVIVPAIMFMQFI